MNYRHKSKRSTYVPSGFTHVGTAKTTVDRNGVRSTIKLIECDACGKRIQSVGLGIGSHRRACKAKPPVSGAWTEAEIREHESDMG